LATHHHPVRYSLKGLRPQLSCVTDDRTLVGTVLDMASAVKNDCMSLLGVPLPDALRFASAHPAAFLDLGEMLGKLLADIAPISWHLGCRKGRSLNAQRRGFGKPKVPVSQIYPVASEPRDCIRQEQRRILELKSSMITFFEREKHL
jgi:hypothetical protein